MTRWRLCAFAILALLLPIVTGIYTRPAKAQTTCQQQAATCTNKCGNGIVSVDWHQIDCKTWQGSWSAYCGPYKSCLSTCSRQARNCERNVNTVKPPPARTLSPTR
jgi:hypothetical protein